MVMRLDAYSLIYQNHLKRCDISVKLLCNFMKLIKRFRKNTKHRRRYVALNRTMVSLAHISAVVPLSSIL